MKLGNLVLIERHWSSAAQVQIQTLPLTDQLILGQLLNLFLPQFPHLLGTCTGLFWHLAGVSKGQLLPVPSLAL